MDYYVDRNDAYFDESPSFFLLEYCVYSAIIIDVGVTR